MRFEDLSARVRAALAELVLRVEHVGSTAAPGLSAKPIIDLDVLVASRRDFESALRKLVEVGYIHEGDLGVQGREAFRSPAGDFQHHLYVARRN